MKKIIVSLVVLIVGGALSSFAFCQNKTPEPYIISILPDSFFVKYDYSQTLFVTVSVPITFGTDPTEKAIENLKKQIITICKTGNVDGFILNQLVFLKPFDEGKLIGYGMLFKRKTAK